MASPYTLREAERAANGAFACALAEKYQPQMAQMTQMNAH